MFNTNSPEKQQHLKVLIDVTAQIPANRQTHQAIAAALEFFDKKTVPLVNEQKTLGKDGPIPIPSKKAGK